jgi:hypothetical protein
MLLHDNIRGDILFITKSHEHSWSALKFYDKGNNSRKKARQCYFDWTKRTGIPSSPTGYS